MNSQHLANFIKVGKSAQKAMNEKYHDGEFSDPALYDPEAAHPTTWSNVKIWASEKHSYKQTLGNNKI